MTPQPADETIAELLQTMNKGQYLLFTRVLATAGGEVRLSLRDLASAAAEPPPRVTIDASDGAILVRLIGA